MGGGLISGRVRALNLTVPLGSGRVGSDDLGYGPGSGFSFEPVQTSSINGSRSQPQVGGPAASEWDLSMWAVQTSRRF